jgi:hypothetical protein
MISMERGFATMLSHSARPGEAAVLTKALVRAAQHLGLTQRELGEVVGLSASSVSRLFGGKFALDPATKEGELALLFLRIFRSLDALVGGSAEAARSWLRSENHHLAGIPLERIKSIQGLVDVVAYLDAMRGKT